MSLASDLNEFQIKVLQCENLIANAHKTDAKGNAILPAIDQSQITVAGFMNMFIAWETFLESSLAALMTGTLTISGNAPTRYVMPPTLDAARDLVIGTNRYFDYANHQNVIKMVRQYFLNGYPYEPHLSGIYSDLQDLRTMRNASAHISSTTQTALDALFLRIFGAPSANLSLYDLLTSIDPRSAAGETVFGTYKSILLVTAGQISRG